MSSLSDKRTRAFKLQFVGSLVAIVVVIVLRIAFLEPMPAPSMVAFLLVGGLVAVAWTARRYPWALADEVIDEGDGLLVRRRSVQARVAFDDIVEVDRDATRYARHVRLTLARNVPPFGSEIVFRPRDYASMTTEQLNSLIERLRSRLPRAALPQRATEQHDAPLATVDDLASRAALTQKRVILACALLLLVLAVGNFSLEWKWFAPFDKQVMVGCLLVAVIVLHFFAPTAAEMDRQVDARIVRKERKRESW